MVESGIVKLEVTDKDFAQTFNARMASLFSRDRPNKIFIRERSNRLPMFIVKYCSRQLVALLRQPLDELLKLAARFRSEFLLGLFDAEGHVDVRVGARLHLTVAAENSNRTLLQGATKLLLSLNIRSRIERKRMAGTIKVIRGGAFAMKRTSFSLVIGRLTDVKRFALEVGFSIQRKALKLADAILIIDSASATDRPTAWKQLYAKNRGEWIRTIPV